MISLTRLFRPKSISVIGGGVWCEAIIAQCRNIGYSGEIWPVHPEKEKIRGLVAYKKVQALPQVPDAVFIGVNRRASISIIADLAVMGAGGAICFASGFSEAIGEDEDGVCLQAQLINASGDMPIIGPNCYGFLNYLDGAALWPDQHGGERIERGVAIVTQSSNIAINITMQKRGVPIAYVVTVGNQAKVNLAQVGYELLQDPRVTALGCHIEGFGDIKDFEELAILARKLNKPILTLKVGKSIQAQKNTISHTASLAGSDAGADAFLKRLGVARVQTLSQFLETLKVFHLFGKLPGGRMASLSCSGGEASLMADAGAVMGGEFPPLEDTRKERLRQILGEKVALANPLDYHTYIWHDETALTAVFSTMAGKGIDITCVILDFPREDRCDLADWQVVLSSVERAAHQTGHPFAVISSLPETMPEAVCVRLLQGGIAPMCGIDETVMGIQLSTQLYGEGNASSPPPVLQPSSLMIPGSVGDYTISEFDAKNTLAEYGAITPAGGRAETAKQAATLATEIGFPVVLKGEGFAHKSENSAVVLNLCTPEAVLEAARLIKAESYLVEAMVPHMLVEVLLGVIRDPVYGLMLVVAAGGIYTEILEDKQILLVPSSRADIKAALCNLKIAPLLNGYRGQPPVSLKALIDTVMAVQNYAIEHIDVIEEIEINPVFCREKDAVVVDALMRLKQKA